MNIFVNKKGFHFNCKEMNFDVVVIGGWLAGICVAIAAARLGCKKQRWHIIVLFSKGIILVRFGSVTKGIFWGFQRKAPIGTNCAVYNKEWSRWESKKGSYVYRLNPISYPYGGNNVINGVARPTDWPNLWISDPQKPLPQFLEIDFKAPKKINTIYVTFDSNLDENIYLFPPWGILGTTRVIKECVRDYALYFHNGSSWIKIFQIVGNYQRHRIHHLKPVITRKLRLEIQATNGTTEARIFEVRVYGERNIKGEKNY